MYACMLCMYECMRIMHTYKPVCRKTTTLYVCMHACMYACSCENAGKPPHYMYVCMRVRVRMQENHDNIGMYVCTRVGVRMGDTPHTCVCMYGIYLSMHVRTRVCVTECRKHTTDMCMHVWIYVSMHVRRRVCVRECKIYIHRHVYVCMLCMHVDVSV